MRRKPGSLVPLEVAICRAAARLKERGSEEFHGYQIAKQIQHVEDRRLLTAHGTLYRALGRLEQMGLVEARWEAPHLASEERRPARRLYRLTAIGEAAAGERVERARSARALVARKRPAPA
ncbi:MAG TPA: helix-turn-helix transcriptional regulator [Vicinamibacterales bacterium]|nr:helix-turn-helix transcriptional regulator [Vicinamibacterales bacterium]